MNNSRLPYLLERLAKLPHEPGVYIMRNKQGTIIYIGKAKDLYSRVSSYFRSFDKHTEKTYRLVENIYDFDYIVAGSEFEALVLEASMIKQYQPKYNILLKDDKGYNYIKISSGDYPKITAERIRDISDGSTFLGPFMSSMVVTQTVEEVNTIFKLPTCNRRFPEDFRKQRPCLNFHIKRCLGYCQGRIKAGEYQKIIKEAVEFIQKGSSAISKNLEKEMEEASEKLQFERAAQIRDRIKAIGKITDQQNVVFMKSPEQDVIALVQSGNQAGIALIKIRAQRLIDKQDFFFSDVDNRSETLSDFLMSYYGASNNEIPPIISVDGEIEDAELLTRYFGEKAGRQVIIHVPQRGEKVKLVEMARQNAAQMLSHRFEHSSGRGLAVLDELAKLIGMSSPPRYIEAYDISNFGEDAVVGGMVVFADGRPLKSAYKKFNIKTVEGTDDYGSMREVVQRRMLRYAQEKSSGEGFGRLPDLILLDGGKGHVNAVQQILDDLGYSVPLFGLVKDKKHRTRAIATNGDEIGIQANRATFTLLSTIQDEVHRFAIGHMKTKKKKDTFTSQLTSVKGIGKTRLKALLMHFKTQKALRSATVEELAAVKGMNRTAAQNLYDYFQREKGERG